MAQDDPYKIPHVDLPPSRAIDQPPDQSHLKGFLAQVQEEHGLEIPLALARYAMKPTATYPLAEIIEAAYPWIQETPTGHLYHPRILKPTAYPTAATTVTRDLPDADGQGDEKSTLYDFAVGAMRTGELECACSPPADPFPVRMLDYLRYAQATGHVFANEFGTDQPGPLHNLLEYFRIIEPETLPAPTTAKVGHAESGGMKRKEIVNMLEERGFTNKAAQGRIDRAKDSSKITVIGHGRYDRESALEWIERQTPSEEYDPLA
jgi:predicted RNA binding protein YcfA (HicA-like mRNA interferase family)